MQMIETARLHLRPATRKQLQAELAGRDAFAEAMGMDIPADWPPELFDADAITYFLSLVKAAEHREAWSLFYIVLRADGGQAPALIGAGGFKGPPDGNGVVELGYSILPAFRRRGFATEAVRGWTQFALSSPRVERVIAQTLSHLAPSIGVLAKAGFRFVGRGDDPDAPQGEEVMRYELSRADPMS